MNIQFEFSDIPRFAEAMRKAPAIVAKEVGRGMYLIGKVDIERMRTTGLARLNIRREGFRKSIVWKSTPSGEIKSLKNIELAEYVGAKPFAIFQTGGSIQPLRAKTLTILTDAARTAGGRRKYTIKELRDMVQSKQAQIIDTKAGPAIVLDKAKEKKKGGYRQGAKFVVLAWLKPMVNEGKRIDFYGNFEANSSQHQLILDQAAVRAIQEVEASYDTKSK